MHQRHYWSGFILLLVVTSLAWSNHTPQISLAAASTSVVTGSLQDAVDNAKPGDVLELDAQAYQGTIVLKTSGTKGSPITLRGAGIDATTIQGRIAIDKGVGYWNIENLEVDAQGDKDDAVDIDRTAHHIEVRRVELHNGQGYGVRIGTGASDIVVEDCRIHDFDAGSKDAHGIGIMTASNITIRRCEIFNTSGDSIQSNTPDYPGYEQFASNILIEENKLYDSRENALDIKSTHGLIFRNNDVWGFAAVDTSDGMAIQVQYDARDIQIIGNRIWSAVEGIEVSRGSKNGTKYPLAPQRVLIAGNLIRDMAYDAKGDSGSGSGIVVRTSSDVQIYNNTIVRTARMGLYVSQSGNEDYPRNLEIRNNVFDGDEHDLQVAFDADKAEGLQVDYNHYSNNRVNDGALQAWQKQGFDSNATMGDAQLDDELLPRANSPLVDSGTDVGLPFEGDAPDRGWGEFRDGRSLTGLPQQPQQPEQPRQPVGDERIFLPLLITE